MDVVNILTYSESPQVTGHGFQKAVLVHRARLSKLLPFVILRFCFSSFQPFLAVLVHYFERKGKRLLS